MYRPRAAYPSAARNTSDPKEMILSCSESLSLPRIWVNSLRAMLSARRELSSILFGGQRDQHSAAQPPDAGRPRSVTSSHVRVTLLPTPRLRAPSPVAQVPRGTTMGRAPNPPWQAPPRSPVSSDLIALGRPWASGETAPLERTIGRMAIGGRGAWTLTCAAIASAGDPYSRIGITT